MSFFRNVLRWVRRRLWPRRVVYHPYGSTVIPEGEKDAPF
jgi:hypothetical protein